MRFEKKKKNSEKVKLRYDKILLTLRKFGLTLTNHIY